jgi:hypothetical protein
MVPAKTNRFSKENIRRRRGTGIGVRDIGTVHGRSS